MCVCVCVWIETDRQRQTDRQTETEIETDNPRGKAASMLDCDIVHSKKFRNTLKILRSFLYF